MKFGSIILDGREHVIVQTGEHEAMTLKSLCSSASFAGASATLQALIDGGEDELDRVRRRTPPGSVRGEGESHSARDSRAGIRHAARLTAGKPSPSLRRKGSRTARQPVEMLDCVSWPFEFDGGQPMNRPCCAKRRVL